MNIELLTKLLDVGREMAENRKLDSLLEYAMRVALKLFGAEYGYLVLLNDDGELEFWVKQDMHGNELEYPEEQISHTIFSKVISARESLVVADAVLDPKYQDSDSIMALQLRSVMCVPLISRGNLLGAIYFENREKKGLFNRKNLASLEYFAAQAAVSIENARLNADLESRIKQRTTELNQLVEQLEKEIVERKRVEDQLRKLSRVVEQSSSTVIITDVRGRIEYVNPAFTRLTGYTPEEAIGQTSSILQSGQTLPEVYDELWKTITAGKVWRGEFINRKKNGEIYWELTVISPIRDTRGEITHFVAIKEDITGRKWAEEKLRRSAITDSLTDTFNRHHFFTLAEQAFEEAKRYEHSLSALMIDVDHFKQINDQYGHLVGDQVLRTLAGHFQKCIRKTDILGRYGGDEFAIVMPETLLSDAYEIAERLQERTGTQPVKTEKGSIPITISIGVSTLDHEQDQNVDSLIDKADQALYVTKNTGRNRVSIWQSGESA